MTSGGPKQRNSASLGWLLLGSPLVLLVLVSLYALVASVTPAELMSQLRTGECRDAIIISLKTTLVSMVAVCVCGTFLALAMRQSKGVMSGVLEVIVTLPAILPPSVAGIALLMAFGRQGTLGPWLDGLGIRVAFTSTAVVMAQVFVATPFYVREAATAFRSVDSHLIDAARLDGASSSALVRFVALPLALPFLVTGLALSWSRAIGEFGATILFAGNLRGVTQTMPLAIYLGFESDLGAAKALAVLLLVIAVIVLVLVRMILGRRLAFAH